MQYASEGEKAAIVKDMSAYLTAARHGADRMIMNMAQVASDEAQTKLPALRLHNQRLNVDVSEAQAVFGNQSVVRLP